MNPLHARPRAAKGLQAALPHVRFPLPQRPLGPPFPFGGGLPQERLRLRNAHDLPRPGEDRQHGLQQRALMGGIADGTEVGALGMLLGIHFGGSLMQQDPFVFSDGLPKSRPDAGP